MEAAFSLEGVFETFFARLFAGAVGFGFYFFWLLGVFFVGELVLGGGVLAETFIGRLEQFLLLLHRPEYVGGAVARPP